MRLKLAAEQTPLSARFFNAHFDTTKFCPVKFLSDLASDLVRNMLRE
jgi:hypothetical protein